MEDLLKILFVVGAFAVWIIQNVAQAKKRASQEFEQAFEEIEDDEEGRPQQEVLLPPPAPASQKPERPVQQGAPTWKELQRQLEQVLGQPSSKPSPQSTQPIPLPYPQRGQEEPPSRSFDKPIPGAGTRSKVPSGRQPVYQPQPTPRLNPQPTAMARSSTSREAQPRVLTSGPGAELLGRMAITGRERIFHRGKFPYLHPDPIANAVLLSEILRPYFRSPMSWRNR